MAHLISCQVQAWVVRPARWEGGNFCSSPNILYRLSTLQFVFLASILWCTVCTLHSTGMCRYLFFGLFSLLFLLLILVLVRSFFLCFCFQWKILFRNRKGRILDHFSLVTRIVGFFLGSYYFCSLSINLSFLQYCWCSDMFLFYA